MKEIEIALKPETLFTIGPVDVTNTMTSFALVSVILIAIGIFVRFNLKLIPGRIQMIFEMFMEFFLKKLTEALGDEKKARKVLPLIMTIFLLLLVGNQITLIPLVENFVLGDHHLFLKPATHYSLPIALALMALGLAHVVAFTLTPFKYLGHFFKFQMFFKMKSIKDLPMACIEFFLGLIEIIGEAAKLVSIATRLFGNLFAEEVVMVIVTSLLFITQFVVPIPFIVLGIMVGIIQAFVFSMLLTLFMSSILTAGGHAEEKAH